MNKGVLQNSPVQQMMASANPSLWNINNFITPPFLSSSSSSSTTNFLPPSPNYNNYHLNHIPNIFHPHHDLININNNISNNNNNNSMSTTSSPWSHEHPNNNQIQESWSQFFLGGAFMGDGEIVLQHQPSVVGVDMKQESSVNSYSHDQQEFQVASATGKAAANWSTPQITSIIPASSPQSCVTTNTFSTNNLLDYSSKSTDNNLKSMRPLPVQDHSSECNSTSIGGALKKSKVQPSSTHSTTFKVRKEKLGDKITALHQLVSPFGKTDTASVLLEAIGYIRFLQSQVEALSIPYLSTGAGHKKQQLNVEQGEKKCVFPEDPGQLFNENCLKRKGGPDQDSVDEPRDLRSRGLCLVPLSCTMHVGSDNGADYWAPATLGGGFR